jgi:curved DNA-binding protein CbpA
MNHYETLEVAQDASSDEIKNAYRKKAQKHHPDRPDGDAETFHQIQKAYDVLSDPERRECYDRTGDDEKPQSLHDIAISRAAELFTIIIDGEKPGNLIDMALSKMQDVLSEISLRLKSTNKKIAKLEKLQNRISSSAENIFSIVLSAKLDQQKQMAEQFTNEININNLVIEIIKTHKDEKPDSDDLEKLKARVFLDQMEQMTGGNAFFGRFVP